MTIPSFDRPPYSAVYEYAIKLEAELTTLKKVIDLTYKQHCGRDYMHLPLHQAIEESHKAEFQSLREQKPVAYMYIDSCGKYSTPMLELKNTVSGYHECWKPYPLYSAPVPASEGMVLAPIEPTEEMLFEGIAYINNKTTVECMYRAMLAAAQKEQA